MIRQMNYENIKETIKQYLPESKIEKNKYDEMFNHIS